MNPLYLAAAGAAIGAVADKDKPLRGAALGGLAGYTGGSALGASGMGAGTAQVGTASSPLLMESSTYTAGAGGAMGVSPGGYFGSIGSTGPVGPMSAATPATAALNTPAGFFGGMGNAATTPGLLTGMSNIDTRQLRAANSMLNNNQRQQQQAPAPVIPPQMGEYQSFAKLSPYSNRIGPSGTINSSTYF